MHKAQELLLLGEFDRTLDPFEMFMNPSAGIPPRVKVALQIIHHPCDRPTYPPQLTQLLDHLFSIFVSLWGPDERGPSLPETWRAQRALIEERWPSRARFFERAREVVCDFSLTHAGVFGKHYRQYSWDKMQDAEKRRVCSQSQLTGCIGPAGPGPQASAAR